jgi:hypothetical protein
MEYGSIVERSVRIVWENKYLILLGILAALGSGSFSGGGGNSGTSVDGNGDFPQIDTEVAAAVVAAVIAIVCVAVVVGLVLWAISVIARGGLIASVNTIEEGGKSSFSQGWSAAWQKVWTLLGIGLLPGIPGFILLAIGLLAVGAYGGMFALFGGDLDLAAGWTALALPIAAVACITIPIALVLSILRNFAERACMLEGLGVIDSYRRGWNVLSANLGEALVLFIIQIAIFFVLTIVLFVPGIIVVLCCLLWPLLLVAQGFASAAVSAAWTLAYRTWTGESGMMEKAPLSV